MIDIYIKDSSMSLIQKACSIVKTYTELNMFNQLGIYKEKRKKPIW